MIKFEVPGMPKGKQRPRATKKGHVYTPQDTVYYENWVKQCARTAMDGAEPLSGPLSLEMEVHMPIPKSWSKKRRTEAAGRRIHPTIKPDLTNVIKAIEDGAQGVCFFDDKQIVCVRVMKAYSGFPKVTVEIEKL